MTITTRRSRTAALCAIALAALLAAGCSSAATGAGSGSAPGSVAASDGASSAPASAAVSDTAPASETAPASTGGTATTTVTVTAPPPAPKGCTSAQLTVRGIAPPAGGAAGHEGLVLLFTNHSTTACTLTGYPGVAGLNSAGAQIAQATRTLSGMIGGCACSHPALLTLQPAATVSAVVEGNIGGPGPCDAFHSLLVTPPNTLTSTHIAATVPSCGFDIHPVVTGQSGGGPAN